MGLYQFQREQKIPASLPALWDFMTSPLNLQKITPDNMPFKVTSKNLPEKIHEGLIITYKVSPVLGIPLNWVTEITHVKPMQYFVDEQRKGPYKIWHHEHWFEEIPGGVLMKDLVSYAPPMGLLGNLANAVFIQKKLIGIFEFRKSSLEKEFGKFNG